MSPRECGEKVIKGGGVIEIDDINPDAEALVLMMNEIVHSGR